MKKSNWKLVLIIVAGILAVVMLSIFGVQSSQNKAFSLEEQVNTADSDIKVQEKRRVDLVYNLADCVKQYDKHEADTLTAIVEGRGSAGDIENVTTAIAAVSEAYPELKSNENYKELMNELSITENLIAEYRSNYNKQIKVYRRYVRKFPTRIFLDILGYEVQEYTKTVKESIINVLALFGAVILVISIWLVMFTLLAEWKEHVKEKKRRRKRAYEVAHRFEKKPLAKCYCIDCRHCQGFRFADDPFEPKAIKCDLWNRDMVTYDNSFCYRADPRK